MNKQKYLHRKGRDDKKWRTHNNHTKNLYGEESPFRESIRDKHKNEARYYWNWETGIDFTPVGCYLEENVNREWSEVYSEIIKKIQPKKRWQLERYLHWQLAKVVFNDYMPYLPFYSGHKPAIDWLFIDENCILRKYNTIEELEDMAIKKVRRDKLIRLLEIEKENDAEEKRLSNQKDQHPLLLLQ
jgi:hypothetical protein